MNSRDLKQYRKNLYSQNGEDGILDEIWRRLGIAEGWFVEFGAWDGKHLSNAYHLLADKGWHGVFIECREDRYLDLLKTKEGFAEKLHTICAMVGYEGDNKLDDLLAATPIPKDFEMLSIDIDSYDLEVWNAVEKYRPKLVVIECNSAYPPGMISTHNPPTSLYASFTALTEVGKRKGYTLVCHTGNCFFVLNELVPKLELDPQVVAAPEKLFDYPNHYKERLINVAREWLPSRWLHAVFNFSGRLKESRKSAVREKAPSAH